MKGLAPLPHANLAPPTFLFGDLVGWTALTAEHGDEHGAELAIGFRRRAALLLPGHRAQEIKAMGDGIMLRCDEPARAVRLGLQLVDCAELPVRLGIHTGPAVERDGDWYGTTVNVAARLCAAAEEGEVLVSEATVLAAGPLGGVMCGEARPYTLHNLREPVPACVVRPLPPGRRHAPEAG